MTSVLGWLSRTLLTVEAASLPSGDDKFSPCLRLSRLSALGA
jgi:hypothetical protein